MKTRIKAYKQSELAVKYGVTRRTIQNWYKNGDCAEIEYTKGTWSNKTTSIRYLDKETTAKLQSHA